MFDYLKLTIVTCFGESPLETHIKKEQYWPGTSFGVVVITTAQLHSTKPELMFCAGSNPAHGVLEIYDGDDL